jgi:hypothetical protein
VPPSSPGACPGRDRVRGGVGTSGAGRGIGGRVGRRRGGVVAAVVLDVVGGVGRHGGTRVLDHDRRHVLARAGVGARGLLLDVGGAVAVGVVEAVVDAVAVGVGQRRIGARLDLDRVAQAVVVRVLVAVADAVVVAVRAGRRGAGADLGAVGEAVAVGVLGGVAASSGSKAVAALPDVGHPVAVGVGALGGERRGALRSLDRAAAERDGAAAACAPTATDAVPEAAARGGRPRRCGGRAGRRRRSWG